MLTHPVGDHKWQDGVLVLVLCRGLDLRGLDLRGLDLRGLDLRGGTAYVDQEQI